MKSEEEIKALYESKKVDLSGKNPTIASCQVGVSACIHFAALKSLGVENVSVYDGSWSEYSVRSSK